MSDSDSFCYLLNVISTNGNRMESLRGNGSLRSMKFLRKDGLLSRMDSLKRSGIPKKG
ncbi:unnamed protein product [Dovyalis caffra]|uniref:Uncharacterized protein n=1 Tax=Dovyalis caffra TaxID=77055 RepID=A0AAV1RLU3_9ROSI|nr:unnamed protein product [Dovyalis caffra]